MLFLQKYFVMNTLIVNALVARKESLKKELDLIDELLHLYKSSDSDNAINLNKDVQDSQKPYKRTSKGTKKDVILKIIEGLGGSASVKQVFDEYIKRNDGTNVKAVHNTVRNYIHILKTEGVIEATNQEDSNKYIYVIKK